ncbi:MAG: BMC domain-containing protein [Candidatus Marinimicrobia bacterium]|nr:BMC domain-containing protein [Candidatus Neomarinimicrobiota bacterium]
MSEKKPTPGELRRQKAARKKTAESVAVEEQTSKTGEFARLIEKVEPQPSKPDPQPPKPDTRPLAPDPRHLTPDTRYPAIALIEYSSVTTGIICGDAMIKRAPIAVIKSGTVHNGKYLVLIGGSVGAVDEAYAEGLQVGGTQVVDSVILPVVHEQVHDSILGQRRKCEPRALGICETYTVAATLRSADAGVKGAEVNIVEIRLADDIGGKAFAIFNGDLFEVEAAVRIARESCTSAENWLRETIIPNLHPEMAAQVDATTYFSKASLDKLTESE